MAAQPERSDQFEGDGDAVKDGGATTNRGRRDTGQPGPDPEAVEQESERSEPKNASRRQPNPRPDTR